VLSPRNACSRTKEKGQINLLVVVRLINQLTDVAIRNSGVPTTVCAPAAHTPQIRMPNTITSRQGSKQYPVLVQEAYIHRKHRAHIAWKISTNPERDALWGTWCSS
jgi:hypothetical protein